MEHDAAPRGLSSDGDDEGISAHLITSIEYRVRILARARSISYLQHPQRPTRPKAKKHAVEGSGGMGPNRNGTRN